MDAEDIKQPSSGGTTDDARCPCESRHRGSARHAPSAFVYALGKVRFHFKDQGVEKELAQSMNRVDTAGMTDREALSEVLNRPDNRYLTRQLCYVLTIQGVDAYVLVPRDPADFALLADAIRPSHQADALDVVIGVREGDSPLSVCGGLQLPVVTVDQLYSATIPYLVRAIERPASMDTEQFDSAASDLLTTVMNVSGNMGASDEHRALSYLMVRYPVIYRKTFERFMDDYSLASIDVRPSNLGSRTQRIMDVIFTYASRTTDEVEKYFVPVNVASQFPFRTGSLGRFFDHS